MKRIIAVILVVLIFGGLVAWRLVQKRQEVAAMATQGAARARAVPQVCLATAGPREILSTFEGTGTLEAPLNVKISPKTSGRITYLRVQEGDQVRRGQVLVRLDASEIEAQVRQAEAAVSEANYRLAQALISQKPTNVGVQTQVKQQQAAVASAQADYEQSKQTLQSRIAAADDTVTDADGRLQNTQAAIGNATAGIGSAKATLNNANTRLSRVLDLYKQGYIAAQEVDDAKAVVAVQEAALQTAQGQLKAAQAAHDSALAQKRVAEHQVKIVRSQGGADVEAAHQKLLQAQAALEFARANTAQSPAYREGISALRAGVTAAKASLATIKARRADTVLYAPTDGYVTERLAEPGAMAGAGQPVLAIQFFREIWVNLPVPDQVRARVNIGDPVSVAFDSIPGRVFTASVIKANPSADPSARQFTIRATLSNAENLFKPGMFARCTLVTSRVTGLAVPREAVDEGEEGTYVNVVDAEMKSHLQPVTTGAADANFILISEGLNQGDRVVTLCAVPLRDDQTVKLAGSGDSRRGGGGGGRGEAPAGAAGAPSAAGPAAGAPAGAPAGAGSSRPPAR